jgi:long-chain acyl-CoA synthetase
MTPRESFLQVMEAAVAAFPDNRLCRKLDAGALTLADYQSLLRMLFHQTFEGPSTFALAAAHCAPRHQQARDYLIAHAEEEKSHWQWVINDLRATGDHGPDPRTLFAEPACAAYVAFNVYTAIRQPLARLGIAAVLEGIGAVHGTTYGQRLVTSLRLDRAHASFFLSHGALDVGHVQDVMSVIESSEPTAAEWAWLAHAARVGGLMYRRMYDEAAVP